MSRAEYVERDLAKCRRDLATVLSWRRLEYLIKRERQLAAQLDQVLIDAAIDNLQPTPYEVRSETRQETEARSHLGRA